MLFINRINVKSMNHLSRQELVKNRKKSKDLKQPINYHKVQFLLQTLQVLYATGKKFSSSSFSQHYLVTPHKNCRLKLLKLERIKDFLLMEDEFIQNQERLKPQEEKNEVMKHPIKMLTSSEVTSLELTPDIGIDIEHP